MTHRPTARVSVPKPYGTRPIRDVVLRLRGTPDRMRSTSKRMSAVAIATFDAHLAEIDRAASSGAAPVEADLVSE